ncbi:hypothetical protein BJ742DRAFT_823128 [Cladochytrium replicatum]|nr:hypothetical protein BJ742DRAFT_823128 [Cladochytrium replicatum]
MRLLVFGAVSSLLAALVVGNAWIQRGHFYNTCIHLTRSSASLLVLLNFGAFLMIMAGRFLQKLFFGDLRALELEHLYDNSWVAVTETLLAMTIIRDEFDVTFVTLFMFLLFVKIFHWISNDRIDFMEQIMNPPVSFHVRMVIVMSLLLLTDFGQVWYAIEYTQTKGSSMMIIFGFEYAILSSLIVSMICKYILHTIDLRSEAPWEQKSMYLFYLDLVTDFFKLITYFLFFAVVVHFYGFPLHIVRDLYLTCRSFLQRCRDLVQYRRATANMNERYPDATLEELNATDRTCIICREEMELPGAQPEGNDGAAAGGPAQGPPRPTGTAESLTPKKLPCGHIFHFRCLRSWLERQRSCPTCRRSVLEQPTPAQPPQPAAQAQQPPPVGGANQHPPAGQPPVPGLGLPAFLGRAVRPQGFLGDAQAPAGAQPGVPAGQAEPTRAAAVDPPRDIFSAAYLGGLTLTPLVVPGQSLPSTRVYEHLSDEQLRSMEGTSRQAILARLEALQNVQHQLVGVTTQLTQLLSLMPEAPAQGTSSSSSSGQGAASTSLRQEEREQEQVVP